MSIEILYLFVNFRVFRGLNFGFSTRTRAAPAVDSGVSYDYRLSEPLKH